MKIVVFGMGKFYERRKQDLFSDENIELVAIIDNNQELQGKFIDGVTVLAVEQIVTLDFDIVVLMSKKDSEMKQQICELGIDSNKIWYWAKFKSEQQKGIFCFYCGNKNFLSESKKILIITSNLGYTGGAMAAVYAAKALQMRKYNVMIMASGGNPIFLREMKKDGLNIVICPALPYLYETELAFIKRFDIVIVNVLPMIICACEISKIKPVFWWIHETSFIYEATLERFEEYAKIDDFEKINIYAVSKIAQKNFNYYFPDRITKTLSYGIPDDWKNATKYNKNKKFVFAVIGSVVPLKGYDLFFKAVNKLPAEMKNNASFWLIGLMENTPYCNEIRDMVSNESSVELLGEMSRKEIQRAYEDIDVLVCPSMEETMSIVVTEAMMYGKTCIVSDMVGMADYICEGQNGLIFKMGAVDDLIKKMSWIFYHKEKLEKIGENARKTYEEYFTMDRFGDRLEQAIYDMLNNYEV